MYDVDDPSATGSRPAPAPLGSEGWHLQGVAGGAQGTVVTADHKNMVQQEMKNIRALNPVDPGSDKTDDAQLATAILEYVQANLPNGTPDGLTHEYVADGGGLHSDVISHPGACRSEDGSWGLEDAVGQQRDITTLFTTGGAGGLSSAVPNTAGVPDNTGWYPYHALWTKAGAIGYGWDLAANYKSAAGLLADAGAGWDYHRRLGWHYFDVATPSLLEYLLEPDQPHEVRWLNNDNAQWSDTSFAADAAVLADAVAPPRSMAHIELTVIAFGGGPTGSIEYVLSSTDQDHIQPDSQRRTLHLFSVSGQNNSAAYQGLMHIDASSQFRFSGNVVGSGTHSVRSWTAGYQDFRVALP